MLFTTEPVINTPIQPNTGENNGKIAPALAIPCPIATVKPPYVITLAIARIAEIVRIGNHNSLIASTNKAPALFHFNFVIKIVIITVNKIAVPVAPIKSRRNAIPLGDKSLTVFGIGNFITKLSSAPPGWNNFLKNGALHTNTKAVKMTNGLQAKTISLGVRF
ncbi:Uncharacterised protein [Staphylococcus aureus]|nr:Uncharacterised protein [Staphylococcus aureus]